MPCTGSMTQLLQQLHNQSGLHNLLFPHDAILFAHAVVSHFVPDMSCCNCVAYRVLHCNGVAYRALRHTGCYVIIVLRTGCHGIPAYC